MSSPELSPDEPQSAGMARKQAARRIAALPVTVQEKAVLICLLEHCDWSTLSNAYPSNKTIAEWTSLQERQVQRWLTRLTCTTPRRHGEHDMPCGRCVNSDGTAKVEVLLRTERSSRFDQRRFTLVLSERGEQMLLPEVGSPWAVAEALRGVASDTRGVASATPGGGVSDTPGVAPVTPRGGASDTRSVSEIGSGDRSQRSDQRSTAARERARGGGGHIRTATCPVHDVEGRESLHLEGQYYHPRPDGPRCEFVPGNKSRGGDVGRRFA